MKTILTIVSLILLNLPTSNAQMFGKLKNKIKNSTKIQSPLNKTEKHNSSGDNELTKSPTGKEYFVSTSGRGKIASMEKPAKDLAVIIRKLKDGDIVHIAGGIYKSKLDRGSDVIGVSVSIIGGYSPDFSTRDPWGKYKTILTGTNDYSKGLTTSRLRINGNSNAPVLIDGLIIDNGPRNRYKSEKHQLILRKANAVKGENPTPETPGIKILMKGVGTRVTVKNCIIMNTAPTQGALDIQLGKDGKAFIKNNLIVNNTGEGIMAKSNWHGNTPINYATYIIENNTILFNWKHDAVASYGGNSLMMDQSVNLTANNNIFGFGDFGGVYNIKKCENLVLNNNNFIGHRSYDFFDEAGMKVSEMEDYADFIKESNGNVSELIQLQMNSDWASLYAARKEISRAAIDASSKVSNSTENQIRGILGLNKMGTSVSTDASIWLHQLRVNDAIKLGLHQYNNRGCQKP